MTIVHVCHLLTGKFCYSSVTETSGFISGSGFKSQCGEHGFHCFWAVISQNSIFIIDAKILNVIAGDQWMIMNINPLTLFEGNEDYIMKVSQRPVAYRSYCLCSLPEFFHTVTGACLPEVCSLIDRENIENLFTLVYNLETKGWVCVAFVVFWLWSNPDWLSAIYKKNKLKICVAKHNRTNT